MVKFLIFMLYSFANNGKLSGRADGNVYDRSGRVRGFKVPKLVQNSYTMAVRNRLGSNSSDWNQLDDSERNTWLNATGFTTVDRFGRTIPLTGKNLFCSLNNNLKAVSQDTRSNCPTPETVVGITSLSDGTFDVSDSVAGLNFSPSPTSGGTRHLIFATGIVSAGTTRPNKSYFRVVGVLPDDTATGFDFGSLYVAKFGLPSAGNSFFVKLVPISTDTGIAGNPVFAKYTCVA